MYLGLVVELAGAGELAELGQADGRGCFARETRVEAAADGGRLCVGGVGARVRVARVLDERPAELALAVAQLEAVGHRRVVVDLVKLDFWFIFLFFDVSHPDKTSEIFYGFWVVEKVIEINYINKFVIIALPITNSHYTLSNHLTPKILML